MSGPPLFYHVFASFGRGGVPLRIAGYLNWLGERARHVIVALDGDHGAAEDLVENVQARLETVKLDGNLVRRLCRIRQNLTDAQPRLLLTYNWGAIEWALGNRLRPVCPHIHFESGFGKEEADGQITRRVWMRRFALARSFALVMPSASLVGIARRQWKVPEARIRHIVNGVDSVRFGASPDVSGIPGFAGLENRNLVGTVAPLRPEKNLFRLIRVFRGVHDAVPDARLVIVGDGAERAALQDYAHDAGVGEVTIFTGHLSQPELVYGAFDVFAMSSDTEQMPNVVLQAMSSGLPVAATDVGDIATMVAEENRDVIVPRDDDKALSGAITMLLRDKTMAHSIGQANRQKVRTAFGLDRMHKAYDALIKEALS